MLPRLGAGRDGQRERRPRGDEIASDLSFLTIALLVFSGVIVVVAAFLIFNTFSITVAQRIREFGLLRTLGATRAQILWSVVGEALLIGGARHRRWACRAASPPRRGCSALFKAIGIDLPSTGNVFLARDRDRRARGRGHRGRRWSPRSRRRCAPRA